MSCFGDVGMRDLGCFAMCTVCAINSWMKKKNWTEQESRMKNIVVVYDL